MATLPGNELNERKRRSYLAAALVIAAAAFASGWGKAPGPIEGGVAGVFLHDGPLIAGVTALLFGVLLWRLRWAVRLVEGIGLSISIVLLLLRLAVLLYGGVNQPGQVALSALWFAPLYALLFAGLPSRRAVKVSLLTYAAGVLLGLPRLLELLSGAAAAVPADELLQLYSSTAVVLLFLGVHAHLKDQSIRAQALAETMVGEAQTDFLVGLPNRRQLQQILVVEREAARREGQPASLIMFDVDRFKRINDTFGHQVGDQVLVEVARRTRRCLRRTDTCGRWGGEEFVVVIPGGDLSMARHLAERVREEISREPFPGVGTVTASFGVADLVETLTLEIAVGQADEAMYRAKQNGRNQVEVW